MNTITKEQRIKAIEDSIKHWEDDIVKPLQEGRFIDSNNCKRTDNGEMVKCNDINCPLCRLYYFGNISDCENCPLESCSFNSTWFNFAFRPTLKNAQAMVYELRAVLMMEDMKHE